MSRTLFFQQNDTKINNFDEGILIPVPFLRQCHFQNLLPFCIKSQVRSREEFLSEAPRIVLRNECLSLFMLALIYSQSKSRHFTREAKQWQIFDT